MILNKQLLICQAVTDILNYVKFNVLTQPHTLQCDHKIPVFITEVLAPFVYYQCGTSWYGATRTPSFDRTVVATSFDKRLFLVRYSFTLQFRHVRAVVLRVFGKNKKVLKIKKNSSTSPTRRIWL